MQEEAGLTTAECEQAAWAITPGGDKARGAAAINIALDALLGHGRICSGMYNLPLIGRAEDAIYGWIAQHRGKFPGVTPAVVRPEPWQPQRE